MASKMRYASVVAVLSIALCCVAGAAPVSCPPGKPLVNCVVAPCDVNQCKCGTGEQCVNDYCGGCNCYCQPTCKKTGEFCSVDVPGDCCAGATCGINPRCTGDNVRCGTVCLKPKAGGCPDKAGLPACPGGATCAATLCPVNTLCVEDCCNGCCTAKCV